MQRVLQVLLVPLVLLVLKVRRVRKVLEVLRVMMAHRLCSPGMLATLTTYQLTTRRLTSAKRGVLDHLNPIIYIYGAITPSIN